MIEELPNVCDVKLLWVFKVMETYVLFYPHPISLFGAVAIITNSNGLSQAVEKATGIRFHDQSFDRLFSKLGYISFRWFELQVVFWIYWYYKQLVAVDSCRVLV